MVWRQGASEPYDSTEQPSPWRKGRPTDPLHDEAQVIVEAWDDEIPPPTRAEEMAVVARRVQQRFGPVTYRLVYALLAIGAVLGAAAGVAVAWMHIQGDPLADARAYFDAATRLNAGRSLYPAGIDPSTNEIYLYPPLLAIVLRPLALLPFELFSLVWELIVVGSFILLLRVLGVRKPRTWIALGLLGVPIGWALTIAQAHIPMTWLMAVGQPWSIAIAANLKLFPVLLVLWWLGRREFEAIAAFLMWSMLLILVQVLLAPNDTFAYFQRVGFDQLGEVRNISPFVLSPVIWGVLLVVGALATLALARTRWGWAVAVFFATLASPRLLVYMLSSLIAAIREPKKPGETDYSDLDPATVYIRSFR